MVYTFAKWLLAHDILGTWDSCGVYLTKKNSTDSLLKMGLLWDFDSTYTYKEDFAGIHNSYYFYDLLNKSDNNARWNKSGRTLEQSIDGITSFFTEYLIWLDEPDLSY